MRLCQLLCDPKARILRLERRGKNSVWRLRDGSPNLLRSQGPSGRGSPLRRHAGVPGDPDLPGRVSGLRQGETGISLFPLRQPLLHEAVLLLHRPAMPRLQHQGHRQGTASRLPHGQGVGEAVHAGAAEASWHPGAQDHRVRGRREHQDPGYPATGIRNPGRRIPSPEDPDLHAARDLNWSQSTHSITR